MIKSIFHSLNSHRILIIQILLVTAFIGVLAWGASIAAPLLNRAPQSEEETLPEAPPPQLAPIPTPTPVVYINDEHATDGIIFAGVMLVLIIVVGTLGVINQRK